MVQRGGKILKLIVVLLFCLPATALADSGTPLMWAGMLHLVFGNAFIGILEGLLLAFLFKLSRWKCVGVMIVANYFSAWCGDLFLVTYAFKTSELNLYTAWRWVWMMVGITFLLTCLLEWPFVFFCLRKSEHRLKKSIWGNLVVQAASYLLLFGWYSEASSKSLYTQMHIVKGETFPIPANAVAYFISPNGDVCSAELSNGNIKRFASLNNTNDQDRLFLRRSDGGKISICARLATPSRASIQCVVSNMNAVATVPDYDTNEIDGNLASQYDVAQIGSASNSLWEFHTAYWSDEGLSGRNHKTGEECYLAFETPFVQWMIRNAYQLPGDCVVFQLGDDQICILDPNTKRVALVARGRGPVVLLEGEK